MLVTGIFFPFHTVFSTLSKRETVISAKSANAFNLILPKISLFGKGFKNYRSRLLSSTLPITTQRHILIH